jgi:DNA repair exonuclease SbcCD ATPase subunit
MTGTDDEIGGLYGLPLEEFTAARNVLAKRLRADGEKDAAAEVAKLRKPSRPAWAINRAARADPDLAAAVLDAAAGLAEAQQAAVSGSGREALDEAVQAEREAVESLVAAARRELAEAGAANEAMVDRARRTLRAVAGDAELQEELDAARIVSDREPVGFGAATAIPPSRRRTKARGGAKKAKRGSGEREDKATAAEERRRQREAEADEERATRKQLAEARRRAQQAERRFAKRDRDLDRARERLDEARADLAAAEDEVAELAEDLQRRRKELEDARAVLEELS